jgi:hypothetical protein
VADEGNDLRMWGVAANILNYFCGKQIKGGSPASGLVERVIAFLEEVLGRFLRNGKL